MDWARKILNTEKYERFKELLSSPIPTTELTTEIFSHFLKIFEASNSRKDYFFESSNKEDQKFDFIEFLERDETRWKTDAWHEFRNYICSFMVIDLPNEEQKQKGETDPYLSFVHIHDVVDAKIDSKSNVHWLIYKIGDGEDITYVYLDNEKYVVLDKKKNKRAEIMHGFGFVPSRQFWTSNVNDNHFKKKSPLTYQLGKMDFLLFHEVSKEYPELYAKFPIMSVYEEDETNEDFENSLLEPTANSSTRYYEYQVSETGYRDEYTYGNRIKKDDKKNYNIGSGSIVTKSVPQEGETDIGSVVEFITMPTEQLEYINENLRSRRTDVYTSTTGALPDFKNDQAKNEKQVESQHESEKNILIEIKTNFELAEKWAVDSFGKIKYKDSYKGSVINYGTNFFLLTPTAIQEDIQSFKEIGMPETLLLDKQNQYIETVYKTDSKAQSRAKILQELDPFPTLSIKDVAELAKSNLIDREKFEFKMQLPALIKEFERNNADINSDLIEDGSDIDKIREELNKLFNPTLKEDDGNDSDREAEGQTTEKEV